MEDQAEIDAFFEREMPGPRRGRCSTRRRGSGIGFYLGYAELIEQERRASAATTPRSWSTAPGAIVGKYRKVHLPATPSTSRGAPFQHLEKRYFEVGDLGFPVWRAFGRRARDVHLQRPALARDLPVMGLQGVEMILLGYNTPAHNPPAPEHDASAPSTITS